jgi:elongator complex protein 3
LLLEAERIARKSGFSRLAVIAAVGTRLYYARRGFVQEGLYMTKAIS